MKDPSGTNQKLMEVNASLRRRIQELEHSEAERKQMEEALQQCRHELSEQVKELNCLHSLSELAERSDESFEVLIRGVVELLPPALQHPPIACARITLDRQTFSTANFEQTPWQQQRSIRAHGEQVGIVEVCYLEAPPESEERLFLRQEGWLLDVVAERVGRVVERMQAGQALRASEERHRTILKTSLDGFWVADRQGRLLEVNEAYCRMSGYSEPELLTMRIPDLEAVETSDDTAIHIQKVMAQGEDRFETRHCRKDGSIFHAEVGVQYLPIDGGRLVGFLRDITEHKRAEEELKAAKDFLDTVLDNLEDALIVVDPANYTILRANKTFVDYCELNKDTVIGKHCYELTHHRLTPCSPPDDICPLGETLKTGKPSIAEHIHYDSTGKKLYVEISTVPIIGQEGEIDRIIHLSRNITERKEAEQALRHQREGLSHVNRVSTLGEFAASLAHEIHQPLTAIMNNARAAQRFLSSDPSAIDDVRDALQDIIDDDRRAGNVIHHLRSFLKSKVADRTILDINMVIEEVLTILRHEIADRNVSITPDLSPDIPQVEGDRIALQQVIMNLILNGCDSLANVDYQRRQMFIRTSVDELNGIIVTVQDTGTGMDPSETNRVFEPYYTTKQEGLGMGLSISKSIVAAHGGRIWAVNNPEGGATFSFTLPIYKGSAV